MKSLIIKDDVFKDTEGNCVHILILRENDDEAIYIDGIQKYYRKVKR